MKKNFKMPSAYTILFSIIIVVAMLTWIIPAGQYSYVDPSALKKTPIPETYHLVEQNPQGITDVLMAPVSGFYEAIEVALFIIIIGGFLGVVMNTGAIDAGIATVITRLKGRERLMIPILMIVFSLGGTSFGMAEETLAFYPLIVPVFIAAGYDALTAVSVILLGAGCGVLGSTVNPFATGIASGFAGTSIGEGIGLRLLILVVLEAAAIIYTMRYAEKIKRKPSESIIYELKQDNEAHFLHSKDESGFPELTGKRKLALILFILTFITMVFGVIPFSDMNITLIPTLGWWFGELTTLFLVFAIIIGLVYGMKEQQLVSAFVNGAKDLLGVALIIGLSRGITIIMNAGIITDTILNYGENLLKGLGSVGFVILTYLFYMPLSFLIPSTSGLATLTMPIMAPLGDFAGVTRAIVITAYQSASGLINLITPTSAVVMGGLAIARVPYGKWIKYSLKFMIIAFILVLLVLVLGIYF
ncbi:putative ion transporter superfamily protein YfcC [Clostridium punense]|uniref:Ion transporter superfamily protein YfcC n=1 Tax=Clostridium punense TaxID=1054297 RepID=A0ABS4JZL7_9CLOT|nr:MULTISPECIES: YfcC family protein [Clostridium]EQB87010.1 hypothetical protein M918_11030 [Clostridium sp. BL8]MBP2020981.1 putative ion transporter superfamily protein YfcC [Clostridium punense]